MNIRYLIKFGILAFGVALFLYGCLPDSSKTVRPVVVPSGIRVGAICMDGTRTSATDQGACSHHGGVRRWLYSSNQVIQPRGYGSRSKVLALFGVIVCMLGFEFPTRRSGFEGGVWSHRSPPSRKPSNDLSTLWRSVIPMEEQVEFRAAYRFHKSWVNQTKDKPVALVTGEIHYPMDFEHSRESGKKGMLTLYEDGYAIWLAADSIEKYEKSRLNTQIFALSNKTRGKRHQLKRDSAFRLIHGFLLDPEYPVLWILGFEDSRGYVSPGQTVKEDTMDRPTFTRRYIRIQFDRGARRNVAHFVKAAEGVDPNQADSHNW